MDAAYVKGPVELADGVWAYLQPDGGWGWSNAGLVGSPDGSLLVDTLFDLKLTAEMLESLKRVAPHGRITTLVNTHANGDHCYGNSLVDGAEIIASRVCALEMESLPPSRLTDLLKAAPELGETGRFVQRIFGAFSFDGIEMALPTRTFADELQLRVGEHRVHLVEVGPAHTAGDVVVHLPDDGVVFTGDILFNGGHPIVWAGPVANWVLACERVIGLGAATVVPGHGPVTGPSALEDLAGYFRWLTAEARPRFDAGMAPFDAARDIDLGPYAGWSETERMVVNVRALYRDFGWQEPEGSTLEVFGAMAAFGSGGG